MKRDSELTMHDIAEVQFLRDLLRRFHLTRAQVHQSEIYQRALAVFVRRRWGEYA